VVEVSRAYNTFKLMNMNKDIKSISTLLKSISSAPRIRILLGIGAGEACVCHLEAILGWRQSYISQHLMSLRKAKVLSSRRDGRFIFYRLRKPEVLKLIREAARIKGIDLVQVESPENCACPSCSLPE
jgi:DNA-binding transcriptional ArsR family regulator